jgi:Transposase C of IS166 homeodomain
VLKIESLARERAETKLRDLLRRLYGPKSEQLSEDQLRLLLEPLDADEQLWCDTPPAPAVAAKLTSVSVSWHGAPLRPATARNNPQGDVGAHTAG